MFRTVGVVDWIGQASLSEPPVRILDADLAAARASLRSTARKLRVVPPSRNATRIRFIISHHATTRRQITT